MAFKMKNPSLMKMAKMAGDSRVAMKMKQQDAAMKMKKDPMKMKDPMDMKKDPMMMKKNSAMDMKKGPMKLEKKVARAEKRLERKEAKSARLERKEAKSAMKMKARPAKDVKKGSGMKMKKNSPMKRNGSGSSGSSNVGPGYTKNKSKKSNDSYEKALKNDPKLEKYIANRKNLKKGSAEFGINQHKINTAYYGKESADRLYEKYRKKHNLGPGTEKGREQAITLNTKKLKKLDTIEKSGRNVELRKSEVDENFAKKNTRKDKKNVRKGGGTRQEIAAADAKLEQAKIDDMQGAKGGRKGIFRGIRTKIATRRKQKSAEKAKS